MRFSSKVSIFGSRPVAGYVAKLFILCIDLFFAVLSIVLAILLTGNFDFKRLNFLFTWGPLLLLLFRFAAFVLFRSYLMIIRYVGEKDYRTAFFAITLSSVAFFLVFIWIPHPFSRQEVLPIVLVDYFIMLSLSSGLRILLRLIFDGMRLQRNTGANTVIFGAGELGSMLDRVLKYSDGHTYRVVAYFDDNPGVHKKLLNGVRIYNPGKSFDFAIKKYNIKYAIIGINKLSEERRLSFIEDCLRQNVQVLKLPPASDWINNTLQAGYLQNINFNDLLSRPPIRLHQDQIQKEIKGHIVLVTGCAGSIGSEIVRQLLAFEPATLVGVDQAETPLAELSLALEAHTKSGVFIPIISDVRNLAAMDVIFRQYRPSYVFHAAAYKHVPIMELFPAEAIQTNVKGSLQMADLSIRHKVRKFVMVSTDKAVNPSNVMGASKRIAELYVQALAMRQDHNTQFITTRFGNVLGSNGSVIPIFKRQIEQGGPVTITHPEVTRYFMTIPEACQLVLEAGAMGKGGEIFVFDMGQPVKILDLARKMIQLAGLTPGKDIHIAFVGLRPGEKLYEELLDAEEGLLVTHHPKIKKAAIRENDFVAVQRKVHDLIQLSEDAPAEELVYRMKAMVPEFISRHSHFSHLDVHP